MFNSSSSMTTTSVRFAVNPTPRLDLGPNSPTTPMTDVTVTSHTTSVSDTITSLGPYIQKAEQNNIAKARKRSVADLKRARMSVSQMLNPASPLFSHTIKAGVQKFLCRTIDSLTESGKLQFDPKIIDASDVDFVFVVNKKASRSVSFKCANWMARTFSRERITESDLELGRERYLEGLKNTYKIAYTKLSTPDYDFYPIKLSFAHLGLLMQLLGYQWRIRTANEEKTAYKTFYFMKRDVERYHEYHKIRSREDFTARWRYDLTYNFLVGATVKVTNCNPWRGLLKSRPSQTNLEASMTSHQISDLDRHGIHGKEKSYSLLHLFADEIFDDWLVPHSLIPERPIDHVSRVMEDIDDSGTSGEKCCATCCFPCWTCQCKAAKQQEKLTDEYPDEDDKCTACGAEFCNGYRSFCFQNSVDCMDCVQRPDENERQFLGRISTVRNGFTRHSFPSPLEEEAAKIRHILPLKTLVEYLGEKIGFYFGWIELLILSLTVPSVIGVSMFICGVIYYTWLLIWNTPPEKLPNDRVQYVLAKACDNYATPAFAATMVIWGTTFYELWQRREKWYGYLWHVEKLEHTELERPPVYSFKSTSKLKESHFFSWILYLPSIIITILFIVLVFISVYFINVMNVFSISYCPPPPGSADTDDDDNMTAANNTASTVSRVMTMATSRANYSYYNYSSTMAPTSTITAASSTTTKAGDGDEPESAKNMDKVICNLFSAAQVIANSISMFVLDFIYTRICYLLTDWEGHKTQSRYTNALVLKLFTFRFFNYYSVLFYIAFGIAPRTVQYPDEITGGTHYHYNEYGCGEQPCMAMLSRQLLSVIVTQPLINSLFDVIVPGIKLIYLSIKSHQKPAARVITPDVNGKTNDGADVDSVGGESEAPSSMTNDGEDQPPELVKEFENQVHLSQLSTLDRREFTTEEYTEKVIVYGALLMFSVALPPAPVLALLIMRIDLNLDIGRIMNEFRRPVPVRSQNIGMWGPIVNFLTYLGIVTNPLIVILTSSWGQPMTLLEKFVVFIGFEHFVFAVRMLVSFVVPDVPKSLVRQQMIHKATKDELQSILLDAKIEQAGARQTRHYRQQFQTAPAEATRPHRMETVAESSRKSPHPDG